MEKHELVDINGNKTGKILTHEEIRNPNNIPSGYYVSVVGVVIINKNNEILLQKRSRFKRANPNKWGICGGKVDWNETPLEAGIRETLEEIGIGLKKQDLKFLSMNTSGKMHYTVYYTRKDIKTNECKLQREELEEIKYFKVEELYKLNSEGFEWLGNFKKMMGIQIIEYQDSYSKYIVEHIRKIVTREFGYMDWESYFNTMSFEEYQKEGSKFWIAINEKNEVIGTIGAQKISDKEVKMNSLYVNKDYRRLGVAKELYGLLLDFTKQQSYEKIILRTFFKFENAIHFYEKLGFIKYDQDDESYFYMKLL